MTTATETNWYSEDIATFGDRIVAAREAIGMTEEELARRLGIRLKTLQGWEQDLSEPRANKLQILAGVLNVSFRWLLTGEGTEIETPVEPVGEDVESLMLEIRQVRSEMARSAERLGKIEKQLRSVSRTAA